MVKSKHIIRHMIGGECMKKIETIKKLFYSYSPMKSDKNLRANYTDIIYESVDPSIDIRALYNDTIMKGFINESVVKANFIKRISLKKSPKHTVTVFELNSNDSRADICMVNGHSEVFEIKTLYDSFARLDKQLEDYFLLYDYITIVIPQEKVSHYVLTLSEYVGVVSYWVNRVGNLVFTWEKKPLLNPCIDSKIQLLQFTKKELLNIVGHPFNYDSPKETLVEYIYNNRSQKQINSLFKSYIKEKYKTQWRFLYDNHEHIYMLDYQWFFKNNVSHTLVYK